MIIEQILKDKGHGVTTVAATERLDAVARLLDEARIGAVVAVSDTGEVAGVLSERDIVRQVARQGEAALAMNVGDAMTREVITGAPTDSLESCLGVMTDRRIRHLPILQDGVLTGIISIGDLVKWKIAETEAEAESLKSYLAS
ncbi:MAG: CBS domain-containing protein [Hyphomonadaceae bacterium]|nr:CBS domain-containing protein [Hyphomonadaceae bacterium]